MVLLPCNAAETEEAFPLLTIGTRTYTNVTVTTKAKKYVILTHSQGMANIKVSELSPQLRQTLGYRDDADEKPKNKAVVEATKWAKNKLAAIKISDIKALEADFQQDFKEKWDQRAPGEVPYVGKITKQMIYVAGGGLFVLWLIGCACLHTICKKAGNEPGILLWLPLFQTFPLLDAARMSRWWVLGSLFGLTQIVWCFRIAKARGKSGFTGFCLLFPFTTVFAFLYLTFSRGASIKAARRERVEMMTLETA
jgi:hypothetical protein